MNYSLVHSSQSEYQQSQGECVHTVHTLSSRSDLPSEKRPDLAITSWPVGNSLKATDLAITGPVSDSAQYSSTPSSLGPERLLKKRELQKAVKYHVPAESQGGELERFAIGASGNVTNSTKKLLYVTRSKQDVSDSKYHRCACHFWVAKTSLTLQKTVASEGVVR